MKRTIHFFTLLVAITVATQAYAQYPKEFTRDQADSTITFRKTEIGGLQSDIATAQASLAKTNADIQQQMADNTKCREDLYSMLQSDRNGYNAYREKLARAEAELNNLRALSADQLNQAVARVNTLETDIRWLRGERLVLIPDHMRRVTALSNGFMMLKKGMQPANTMYTVGTWAKDRDCLWNIAKKPEIYNDPFAWPKIWRNNMSEIKNPDRIYPGQQLSIVKTEVTQADYDLTGYRHRRR